MTLALALGVSASAADKNTEEISGKEVKVRVNGYLVEFPDQGPDSDENGRTLVPVRFASEAMGATVDWNNDTRTASVTKDGIRVDIPVGSDTLTVTKGDEVSTVKMDTKTVSIGGRTMLPIRFVAESLGAYVDWSQKYRTVQIYQGELSSEQIEELQALPITCDSSNWNEFGEYNMFPIEGSFADLRETGAEHSYGARLGWNLTTRYVDLKESITNKNYGEFVANMIREARSEIEYESDLLSISFVTDPSMVFSNSNDEKGVEHDFYTVRGYAVVTVKGNHMDLDPFETWRVASQLSMRYAPQGTYTFPIDVHMVSSWSSTELSEVINFQTTDLKEYGC